ncbi:MAG: PD-(D/E)XK nuclease family protein, partial [archaeon]
MAIYSHSKLSTFQACKYQYKLKYVDRIKVDIPTTIEMFMGSCVHKALEKLYKDLKYKKLNSKEDILNFYKEEWGKQWSDDILIVKDYPKENYKIMGEEFLVNYYDEYAPFNQFTIIGLETEERLRLSDGSFYHVRIDRLASIEGTYYVCDYKTNSKMKSQVEADSDRQLAMYSLWVKNYFKDAQRVVLLWHMLAFNKEISSERTNLQLKELEGEVVSLIKEIESTKEYPTSVTSLCDYCVYKNLCPSFSHEVKLEQKSLRDYQKDDGLRLVNVFSELKEKESAVEGELK